MFREILSELLSLQVEGVMGSNLNKGMPLSDVPTSDNFGHAFEFPEIFRQIVILYPKRSQVSLYS